MNDLKIFNNPEFGEVRMVMVDGEPWFVGKDVAEILGYQDTYGALKKHVDDEDRQNCQNDSFESNRGLTIINESGLYSLVLSSKLESAKKFKRWVTSEVLPTIRKTGSYRYDPFAQKRAEAALNESLSRRAEVILQCAKETSLSLWKELLIRNAAHVAIGQEVLPPPKAEKTYTATEVGTMLGISSNLVGRIAKKHSLKTEDYGVWCHDIARNGQKEVEVFRYNDNGVEAIKEFLYS